ncbi:hypothetical protein PGTUg99_034364 [Puccinia graminis f. sp. tritici]|uniref:Uncharacterized protein n=1 Tax=Puccinia graminis f. sp. tritici TaxID=56615 RepID=A0A5B0S215_PUCGR|nr:hypothetical protein PGTUg99_034364 [Puccinia graminis f. sp. tritici]
MDGYRRLTVREAWEAAGDKINSESDKANRHRIFEIARFSLRPKPSKAAHRHCKLKRGHPAYSLAPISAVSTVLKT